MSVNRIIRRRNGVTARSLAGRLLVEGDEGFDRAGRLLVEGDEGFDRAGRLLVEGDEGFDQARRAWNLAIDQRPAAVVTAAEPLDVVAAIAWARERGLRVAPQVTGHGAAPLGPLQDTVLVRTGGMREVRIDPVARIARLGAGVVWQEAVDAAAAHGLALLAGSAPDVGVVGYTLGGGLSWLGRTFGLASSSVVAIELVTADGRIVRADHDQEPDLFWALRGGGGSFGVVTAVELRLLPIADVYAGILWWPIERGEEVLQTWRELVTLRMPDELTTVARFLRLPARPEVPEPVRGRSFVVVEAFHLGDPGRADALLAPLRALGPENDTLDTVPVSELGQLHMDPPQPVPALGDGMLLSELPTEAIDRLVALAGVDVDSPLLSLEVRQLGGELARSRPEHGALSSIQAPFVLYAVGVAPTPGSASAVGSHLDRLRAAMAPWGSAQGCLNFAETRRDPATLWSEHAHRRLRQIKARVDPDDLIRANHPILGPG